MSCPLSSTTKKVVYESCVRSVLLYAVETWAMTEDIKERIIRQDKQMLRIVTKNGYKEALLQLQLKSLSSIISMSRLRWYGHVMRMQPSDNVSQTIEEEMAGTVGRGRPKKTWAECIEKDLKDHGIDVGWVQDRRRRKAAIHRV